MAHGDDRDRPTLWQRMALRQMRKAANKGTGEPLGPEDWEAFFRNASGRPERFGSWFLRSLPSSPRCGMCGAPFAGIGGRLLRPLGYRQSRKSPNLCATCVESSPPGGTTTELGVLFADIRGFTSYSEGTDPETAGAILRRFYATAEDVLFPEAIIDKVMGDEVMALYIPMFRIADDPFKVMIKHARGLLEAVGYGTDAGPFVELGIGLDWGEAYVGNVGRRQLNDFTAVGDVVNVASRLQGEAAGGEILASARVAERLGEPFGERVEVSLKGKAEPVVAFRSSAAR